MAQSAAPTQPDYRIQYESWPRRVQVVYGGATVADSRRAVLARETRLPPVYYLPREDVRQEWLEPSSYHTYCPFKGTASYWTLVVGDQRAENAVWSYEDPLPDAEPIRGHLAFTRNRMEAWIEEDEEVRIDPVTDVHVHGNPLVDWLLRDAWEAQSIEELVARLARKLVATGVPLLRMNLLVRTLHPQVMGAVHVWSRERDEVERTLIAHAEAGEQLFLESPFVPIFAGRGGLRRRLDGPSAQLDFPVLRDLAADGATDYVAMPITFSDGRIHALTLATDAPRGFATEQLGHLHELLPMVSRLAEVHTLRHTARTLLETYLGAHSGARVLEGRIRRGDGQVIPAAIWWADLRGSTGLAERLPRPRYLELLNHFFEATAGVALEHGGEVLKFIGDAVMAIFPLEGAHDGAARALHAAQESLTRIGRVGGEPPLEIALALHHGEVHYGNIGVPGRLDFTVTGPAVNEVARLEGLSKALGAPLVASSAFAALVPGRLAPLGRHALRGVSGEHEIYGLRRP